MKEKESDKAHRIAISKHFPVSYYGVSMAPSGPRTIAQVCTLEYCHPANGNKGPKQDNPPEKAWAPRGRLQWRRKRGTCEMLIELHPLIEESKGVPIVPLKHCSSGVRCEDTVCLLSNTSSLSILLQQDTHII